MLENILRHITNNKRGVEIGGPSQNTAAVIYQSAETIDNVIFSRETTWSTHFNDEYLYYYYKKGRVIINDAVNITKVQNEVYDFCFSSHCLEHIANPLKAISEWLRIVKNNGYIIIIVPEKNMCFDHKRNYTEFNRLLSQYEKDVGEDDLSTLDEILANHDLSMDPPAGNLEQFRQRSLNNYHNRCLHHFVYSPGLLMQICDYFNCEFVYTQTNGLDIWFVMKKTCG